VGSVLLPGETPDLAKLLNEAKELTSKSRYAEALARFVWYHRHAQAYGESYQTTQRRLTGISAWVELGRRYPRASEKLLEIRDAKTREITAGRGHSDLLLDVVSINGHLKQEAATVELLKTTYAHDPELVQQCYFHIESTLVAQGEYEFCFKLMGDPQRRFKLIQNVWETQKKFALQSTPELPQRLLRPAQSLSATNSTATNDSELLRTLPPRLAFPDRAQQADNYFVGQVGQLVEILVGVGRKAEAEKIQTAALAVLTLPELQTAVADAETRVRERRSSARQHAFGPVVELTLRDPSENRTNCFIDFETGTVVIPPAELQLTNRVAVWDWAKAQDVDAVANTSDPSIRGLLGYELTVVRLADKEWEQIADGKLGGEISKQAWNNSRFGGLPPDAQAVLTVNTVATDPNPSRTYGFRTSAGNLGMLQFVEYTDSPRGSVKIRYKLVQGEATHASAPDDFREYTVNKTFAELARTTNPTTPESVQAVAAIGIMEGDPATILRRYTLDLMTFPAGSVNLTQSEKGKADTRQALVRRTIIYRDDLAVVIFDQLGEFVSVVHGRRDGQWKIFTGADLPYAATELEAVANFKTHAAEFQAMLQKVPAQPPSFIAEAGKEAAANVGEMMGAMMNALGQAVGETNIAKMVRGVLTNAVSQLTTSSSTSPQSGGKIVPIVITADGALTVAGQRYDSMQPSVWLGPLSALHPTAVTISADAVVPLKVVTRVMETCRSIGIEAVSLVAASKVEPTTKLLSVPVFSLRWIARDDEADAVTFPDATRANTTMRVSKNWLLDSSHIKTVGWAEWRGENKKLFLTLNDEAAILALQQATTNRVGDSIAVVWQGKVIGVFPVEKPLANGLRIPLVMPDAEAIELERGLKAKAKE
jgi:biopolymer transport protein ExbD